MGKHLTASLSPKLYHSYRIYITLYYTTVLFSLIIPQDLWFLWLTVENDEVMNYFIQWLKDHLTCDIMVGQILNGYSKTLTHILTRLVQVGFYLCAESDVGWESKWALANSKKRHYVYPRTTVLQNNGGVFHSGQGEVALRAFLPWIS